MIYVDEDYYEYLVKQNSNRYKAIKSLNYYIELLVNDDEKYQETIIRQSKIIDKAIEYIEKVESVNKELKDSDMYWAYNTFFPELLDILKGSDKE